jgi:predicted ester cyclase
MRSSALFTLVLPLFVAACGGEEQPPPKVPEAPVVPPPVVSAQPTAVPAPPAAKASLRDLQQQSLKTALEALNEHDAKKFASVYADSAVISVVGLNEVVGRSSVEANMDEWFRTFGKIKIGFRRVWIKDKTIVLEWVINGTHTGELFGRKMPETPIGHYGLSIVTMNDDGKVVTERRYGDLGVVATQVGATKEKPRAIPQLPDSTDILESKGAEDAKAESAAGAYLGTYAKKADGAYEALFTDGAEVDGILHVDPVKGKGEAKKAFNAMLKAFPDLKLSPTLLLGIGDTAVIEYFMSGTNSGPLGARAATKKNVNTHAVDILHLKDGKLERVWTYQNSSELMSQLDQFKMDPVKPPPEPAKSPGSKLL